MSDIAWKGPRSAGPGGGYADGAVVMGVADTAAGKSELTEHGRQHGAHPVGLLAVLLALDRPTEDQLGAVGGQLPGEFTNDIGLYATDRLGPFGGLLCLVFCLTQQIGQKLFEPERIGIQELLVVEILHIQRMRNGQHERHVGLRVDVELLAAQVVLGLGAHRIDADYLDLATGDLLLELCQIGIGLMGLTVPTHLEVFHRIGGPEHDGLAVLQDQRPGGALGVNLGGTEHIRQDSLSGAGGVVAHLLDEGAVHADCTLHVVAAAVQLAGRPPAGLASVQYPGSKVGLDTFQLPMIIEVDGGQIYLFDVVASIEPGQNPPVQVFVQEEGESSKADFTAGRDAAPPKTSYVTLIRFAAQQLYVPARLLRDNPGIVRTPVARDPIDLVRGGAIDARPLVAWRAGGHYLTAIKLTNRTEQLQTLDPRDLRGTWLTATFQHHRLLPAGNEADTTAVYLISARPFSISF